MITPFQNGYYSMNVLLRSQSREFLTINTLRTKLGRFSDPIPSLSFLQAPFTIYLRHDYGLNTTPIRVICSGFSNFFHMDFSMSLI